jgi:hypothetical protein
MSGVSILMVDWFDDGGLGKLERERRSWGLLLDANAVIGLVPEEKEESTENDDCSLGCLPNHLDQRGR